jgi:hypothetical protein
MTPADQSVTEWELMRLSVDFAHYLDTRDYEKLANLFLPDAVWDRVMFRHEGRQEILEALSRRPANVVTRHVQANTRFTHIDSETVRGLVYVTPFHGPSEGGVLPGLMEGKHESVYDVHDLYKRTPEGWRFAERIIQPALLPAVSPLRKRQPANAENPPLKIEE